MELTPELQEKKRLIIDGLKKTYKVQYDAVQPIPYIKDRLYCVDKVFVEGGVEVCLASELTRDTGGSWERLESYKSIYTDFRLNSKRRIIQGEPGYGKSTLTLQLAFDWCNDVWNSSMRNVEILILLRLRQLGGIQSIYRAIKLFLLADERQITVDDIKKIIQSCSFVNIILDGYDEYPNRDSNNDNDVDKMIVMELFQHVDVTVTTRYLPKHLIRETKRAKLTGFDEEARDEYIRKAVVGENEEAVEQIKRRLYENSVLADLCQVPLIFVMFAHMAHDLKHFMKFTSVTQFFKYMIGCFHEHLKRKFKDTRNKIFYIHETEHHELDKIAFEGLNKQNQQLSWNKIVFQQRVGREFYEQYILIGILVEEQVVSEVSKDDIVVYSTEVRFYHKLFCEWYAAHYFVSAVMDASNLKNTLKLLDPFDLQYLFRFACGLHQDAGKKLINYLKNRPGGDTFAILCILEQTGDVNDIMDSVKDLCSRDVKIKRSDSALLQRSTTQLLEIASNNNIPISCLHLEYSSIKLEGDTIILHSGISLPILPTVEKLHIAASNDNPDTLTEKYILNLFHYGMKCRRLKELMFDQIQLPTSVSPDEFTDIIKNRNIQVRWRPFDIDFHLDLQNGQWEVVDTQVLANIRDSTVSIDGQNSKLQQRSTVQLLHVANNHNVPISSLLLNKSFATFDDGTIILNNGIGLTNLPSLQKIHVADKNDDNAREITERDIVSILLCAMKGQHFNEICFEGWLMPVSISPAFTNTMVSRALNVSWCPFDDVFRLDLQTGHWEVEDFEAIRDYYSDIFSINDSDTILQQRSKVQLLHIAANHDTPVSCVNLDKCVQHYQEESFVLHSGIHLEPMTTVEHICIEKGLKGKEPRKITKKDMKNIFLYGIKSRNLNDISFRGCLWPVDRLSNYIPSDMKERDIRITWPEVGYILDLQNGEWEVADMDTIRALCAETLEISNDNSRLLQRYTIRLLENAAKHDIPISCLYLKESFSKIDAGDVILHSGLRLSCPVSVKKVVISTYEEGREMTETEVVDILMFVQQSHMLKRLEFEGCLLPIILSSDSIPAEMQFRDIKVFWNDYGYSLNLQSGVWEVDDKDTVESLCREYVGIHCDDSELLQRCTLKLLENASYHDIPISCLYLEEAFSKIDAGDVILHSGLRLSCPVSVKKVVIETEKGREVTETEVVEILMFVQQSHMLEELQLYSCLLPQSIPAESIQSILKSRNVKVSWWSGYGWSELNLQSGRWMLQFLGTRQEITDTEYNDTVREFRKKWRHTEWQKAREASEKK